jgi:hypothetical protein
MAIVWTLFIIPHPHIIGTSKCLPGRRRNGILGMEMRQGRSRWRAEMGLVTWRGRPCWTCCCCMSTLLSTDKADYRWYWLHGKSVISSRGLWLWLPTTFLRLGTLSSSSLCVNPLMTCDDADEQAILLFLGCVGTTATGRSHKFWICGGTSPPTSRACLMNRYLRSDSLGDTLHQCPGYGSQEGRQYTYRSVLQ